MLFRYLAVLVTVLFSNICTGQNNDLLVAQLNNEFPNSDLVISQIDQNVDFKYNKFNKTIEVKEETNFHIVSLKPMVNLNIPVFFNDNTQITYTKISKGNLNKTIGDYHPEGIFHSDNKICLLQAYIPKSGETRILTIHKTHLYVIYYSAVPFGTSHYPVKNSTIKFNMPQGLDIDFIQSNTGLFGFKTEINTLPNNKTTYTFTCSNIPSYTEEEKKPPFRYYSPRIYVLPKTYQFKNDTLTFFKDLQHLYNWCKDKTDRVQNEPEKIKPTLNQILEGKNNDSDKIKAIYKWVQDNIRYIAFEEGLAGYVPDNAQNVLYNKYGDCKGMANLLKTMLTLAGYDARLAWIGTREIKDNFTIHNLATSNHVICVLFYNNKTYYLDATNNFASFGINPESIADRQLLIENGNHYILDTIPLPHISENKAETNAYYKILNQEITGNLNLTFQGDIKSLMQQSIVSSGTDEKNKTLERIITRSSSKISAKNISHSGYLNTDSIFKIEAEVSIKGLITKIGDQIYVTPDLFEEISDLMAPDNKKLPLYFPFRQHRKYNIKIEIPQDYQLKKLPDNFQLNNDYLTFSISYKFHDHILEYYKEWFLHSFLIPNNQLPQWNNNLKTIRKAINQPVIFTNPQQ